MDSPCVSLNNESGGIFHIENVESIFYGDDREASITEEEAATATLKWNDNWKSVNIIEE